MKPILTFLGILLCLNSFTQQLFIPSTHSNNSPYAANSVNQLQQYDLWPKDDNYISSSAAAAAVDEVLWSEDFANGLSGNNSSTTQTWTVIGTNDDLWEHDTDGSEGPFAGDEPLTLDSETKENGWMIFDADKGNIGIPQSAFTKKHGELISPSIDLSQDTNVTLKFTHMYRFCCSPDHELKVYVFDGTSWNNGEVVNIGSYVNTAELTSEVELNITEYAALKSDVKIKFSWEANEAEAYYWMIDDVKIIETEAYSGNLLNAFVRVPAPLYGGTTFRIMPLDQISQSAYFFGGLLQSSGYNNIDSARVYAKVVGESYNGQSYGVISQPSEIDTLFTSTGFTPESIGNYLVDIFASNDDEQFHSDTSQLGFEVSQYEYGRDNGNYNQGNFDLLPVNDDGNFEIGNRFVIYKATTLEAVKLRLDQRTGQNAKGKIVVNKIFNDGSFGFISESQEMNIGENIGSWFNFKFDPVPLDANSEYIITLKCDAATSNDDTVFVSIGGVAINTQESFLHDIDGVQENSQPGTWFYITQTPCLRLNFKDFSNVRENNNLKIFSIHPNPNRGLFNLNIKTESTEDLLLHITNVLGQQVYSESLFDVNMINKQINLSQLKKGIYFVNILSETGKSTTQKVIIK